MNSDHPSTTAATNDRPTQVWTVERIRALGAVTDITTAGQIFGLSRSRAYQLAATNAFPARVVRVGSRYRVSVAGILSALG
ncbi:DNA-binding protein, partial [Micromonospora sicca]